MRRQFEPASRGHDPGGDRARDRTPRSPLEATQALQQFAGNRATSLLLRDPRPFLDPGVPLDTDIRADMESRFDADFGGVRVHVDPRADAAATALGARAFVFERHLAFRRGAFSPRTPHGRRLLVHELAHVVQQTRRRPQLPVSRPASLERDARRAEQSVESDDVVRVGDSALPQVSCQDAPPETRTRTSTARTPAGPASSADAARRAPPATGPGALTNNDLQAALRTEGEWIRGHDESTAGYGEHFARLHGLEDERDARAAAGQVWLLDPSRLGPLYAVADERAGRASVIQFQAREAGTWTGSIATPPVVTAGQLQEALSGLRGCEELRKRGPESRAAS